MLDEVLDLLDRGRAAQTLTGQLHAFGDALDLDRRHARVLLCGGVCLGDGGDDLDDVELDLRAVSLDDPHAAALPYSKISDKIYPTTQYLVAVDRLHFKLWHTLAHNARGF